MTTPRPDQRHGAAPTAAGSRSGSGDMAAALGYPGSPPTALNCQSAQALRRGVGGAGTFFSFGSAGRIWTVMLAYTVVSDATFTPTAKFAATITTGLGALPLAVVELALGNVSHENSGVAVVQLPGLPLTGGDSLTLTINGGATVPGATQEASAVVLYSIP